MLRLAKLTDAEYVLDQVAAGVEDYYLGSGEAPGVWTGRLAEQLGLAGVVQADDLRSLIDGCHPGSGERPAGSSRPRCGRLMPRFRRKPQCTDRPRVEMTVARESSVWAMRRFVD